MLDRLPTDILHSILDLIFPPSEYDDRRRTLYACSVVSKTIGPVAQKLLWEEIRLSKPKQLSSILAGASGKKLGTATRKLELDVNPFKDASKLRSALLFLPGVERCEIEGSFRSTSMDAVMKVLSGLSNLTKLTISSGAIMILPLSTSSFPRLVSLSLHDLSLPRNVAERVLTNMSSLKALAISGLSDPTKQDEVSFPSLPKAFLQHLDCLQLPLSQSPLLQSSSSSLYSPPPHILFTFSSIVTTADLANTNPRHLAFHHPTPEDDETSATQEIEIHVEAAGQALTRLGNYVNSPSSKLESICLRPYVRSQIESRALRKAYANLLAACVDKGVEVLSLRGEADNSDGEVIDECFWDYAKELKTGEQK